VADADIAGTHRVAAETAFEAVDAAVDRVLEFEQIDFRVSRHDLWF
jgi:hypothetical protein